MTVDVELALAVAVAVNVSVSVTVPIRERLKLPAVTAGCPSVVDVMSSFVGNSSGRLALKDNELVISALAVGIDIGISVVFMLGNPVNGA